MEKKEYYLLEKRSKQSNDQELSMVPFVNIIPAIIYALVISNQVLPKSFSFWQRFGVGAAFVIVYVICSFLPYVSLLTSIASAIIFIGLAWALCDKVGANVVRIILKVITAGLIGLIELAMVLNSTLRK